MYAVFRDCDESWQDSVHEVKGDGGHIVLIQPVLDHGLCWYISPYRVEVESNIPRAIGRRSTFT